MPPNLKDNNGLLYLGFREQYPGRRAMAMRLAEAQNWRCAYALHCPDCEIILTPKNTTIDHIVPRVNFRKLDNIDNLTKRQIRRQINEKASKSGQWANLVAACRTCNSLKGHVSVNDFLAKGESVEQPF
jgi:5-methylcytosine-specific restriction endonuclease McrA